MTVVFALVILALILFMTEIVPIDVTSILIMVLVIVLGPWTGITPEEGISGFANPATITILAMFVLSDGIRRTGALNRVAEKLIRLSRNRSGVQYALITGLSAVSAGFMNNTPVVAMMLPVVSKIARETRTSPSKLLMPVSFAAMMGGLLTLIGTSTTILASNLSDRLLDHPFSMFEFTKLGVLVLLAGYLYLLTVGRYLVPERIRHDESMVSEYESAFQAHLLIPEDSELLGLPIERIVELGDAEIRVIQLRRGQRIFNELHGKRFEAGDFLLVAAGREDLLQLEQNEQIQLKPVSDVEEGALFQEDSEFVFTELVILSETPLVGESLNSLNFSNRYDAAVLALRRGERLLTEPLSEVPLRGGDLLLIRTPRSSVRRINANRNFVTTAEIEEPMFRSSRILVAVSIVAGVVFLAALGIFPILVSALIGVVLMVFTGCLRPHEVYRAVDWNVIFLLAGVIPLGLALERSGGADFLVTLLAEFSTRWPPLLTLTAFFFATALLTEVVSNNASAVLMVPVAVSAANSIGSNPFTFVLVVTFAASTACLTPIGYQTNLMVYGPGGYHFSDYFRVGFLLQLILAAVTTLGAAWFWGL